ncbi:ABC transporter substrate-binding protein [Pseudophaeobacter sp.]|uniref:ABC transporter substrate-binding protein n=1 Tax=Pseudophaeobacter sp. TaxID=1971739 RepID=UPI003299B050
MRFSRVPFAIAALFWAVFSIKATGAGSDVGYEIEAQRQFGTPNPASVELQILSTTDTALLAPLIESFLQSHSDVVIDYSELSSAELMKAVLSQDTASSDGFDLAISSAMDLQVKLANDGFTRKHSSGVRALMPGWANWRDHVFAFSQEPATILLSRAAFADLPQPKSRQDLIELMRRHPDRFRGRIGTYDAGTSGLGYLFATQDARSSDSFWRLMELFGSLDLRLYCCSGAMIEDVASGKLVMAYNVLGSYAQARRDLVEKILILEPEDYTNMMLRSAVILKTSSEPDLAGLFVDHLLEAAWGDDADDLTSGYPFRHYPVRSSGESAPYRPIQLGPGLMVYLDRLKRAKFLREWHSTVEQN